MAVREAIDDRAELKSELVVVSVSHYCGRNSFAKIDNVLLQKYIPDGGNLPRCKTAFVYHTGNARSAT